MKIMLSAKSACQLARIGQYVFAIAGIAALAYYANTFVRARLFQQKEAQRFAERIETQPTLEKTAARSGSTLEVVAQEEPAEGAVIGTLSIPRIGLMTVVLEGVTDKDLKIAPGHVPGTAIPGDPGNVGIAGHRDTFFRPLRLIRIGDSIVITTVRGEERYRVESTEIVDPTDVQVLNPTPNASLTLVTCYPFYYVGSAPKRFIVHAEQLVEHGEDAADVQ
jgi:sortase A